MGRPTEQTTPGLDANSVGATSLPLNIKDNNFVFIQIVADTGPHITHIIQLQCSADKVNWHDVVGGSLNGIDFADNLQVTAFFIRARVSVAEGNPSTVDVHLQAK